MIINHNMLAQNAQRQMSINLGNQAKSTEKLSSGLRINRAGDDAAGLAISEKMRGQIRGLDQASRNSQDGISMIQTAEGALNETHDILQRMRELAVQSSSDTNTASDRQQIQKEVDQLSSEVSRIGNTTQFNTQKVLDGSFTGTFHIGANAGQNISLSISDMRGNALGITDKVTMSETDGAVTANAGVLTNIADATYTVSKDNAGKYNLVDSTGTIVANSDDAKTFTNINDSTNTVVFNDAVTSGQVTISGATATGEATVATSSSLEAGTYTYDATGQALKDASGNVIASTTDGKTFTANGKTVLDLNGATGALADQGKVTIHGIDVSNQSAANNAITTIQKALDNVSSERSKLGAYQNRLEHTINNLNTSSENLQSAESRIRDTDMAKTVMANTKNGILAQAAQAMLAQANQAPQQVLQLLR